MNMNGYPQTGQTLADNNKSLKSLKTLAAENALFSIPIYQRPYVWGDTQIELLLTDLWAAYERKAEIFYLGTTLVLQKQGKRYELIDGQQRFTTLWLISLAATAQLVSNPLSAWCMSAQVDEPRIHFEIREQVQAFFTALLQGKPSEALPEQFQALDAALKTIESFFSIKLAEAAASQGEDVGNFCAFVFEHVLLVMTQVDERTNLNKLFELINNRGEQLKPHEVLKARMLSKLQEHPQYDAYACLWDACSEMDNYLERSVPYLSADDVAKLYLRQHEGKPSLACALQVLAELDTKIQADQRLKSSTLTVSTCSLAALVTQPLPDCTGRQVDSDKSKDEPLESPIKSVVSFSLLLLHCLRIWLMKPEHTMQGELTDLSQVSEKDLLGIFDSHFFNQKKSESTVTANVSSLIELLWEVRFYFDCYVVKNVEQEQGQGSLLLLRELKVGADGKNQRLYRATQVEAPKSMEMLQSVLYYSQERATQHWMTVFLAYVWQQPQHDSAHYFEVLKRLDNQLFCTDKVGSGTLIERTGALLAAVELQFMGLSPSIDPDLRKISELSWLGTGTPHYWFYKLEFVLWQQRSEQLLAEISGKGDDKPYRIRSKNSVEHIHPQNTENGVQLVPRELLDNFGNLALISGEFNSSLGNEDFYDKKDRFIKRLKKGGSIESLKQCLIFKSPQWGVDEIKSHQKAMEALLLSYFSCS
jgi:hypothetical protein